MLLSICSSVFFPLHRKQCLSLIKSCQEFAHRNMQLSYAVVNGHMCGHDVSLFNIVLVTVWCVHESRHQST